LYFAENLACEAALSAETPRTTTPAFWSSFQWSRKPRASLVQPGVSRRATVGHHAIQVEEHRLEAGLGGRHRRHCPPSAARMIE
jgi:hypothetical protein